MRSRDLSLNYNYSKELYSGEQTSICFVGDANKANLHAEIICI